MRKTAKAFISVAVCAVFTACSGVPDGIIQPDDMSVLLADMHTAESVADLNYNKYHNDSLRKVLKQSVMEHNGVTQDMLDTSMMWYGAHLKKYIEVYEKTEEILQERLKNSDAVMAAQAQLSVSGDSVDIWSKSRRYIIGKQSPARTLTFRIKADRNSKNGDSYTWRGKFANANWGGNWTIVADYQDGSTETLATGLMGDGWQSNTFYTDSTKPLRNVYGTLEFNPPSEGKIYIDSMQLVRNRVNPSTYPQRYRQRQYENGFGK